MDAGLDDLRDRTTARRQLPPVPLRRAIRTAAGESLASLGRAVGVSKQTILAWERGEREPSPARIQEYVTALRLLQREGNVD